MDGWLKVLIAAACGVVIAAGGYYFWSEYSAKKDRESRIQAAEDMAQSARIMEMKFDGCRNEVDTLIKLNTEKAITSLVAIPDSLRSDIELCLKADIMYPFEKSEMERLKLMALFRK